MAQTWSPDDAPEPDPSRLGLGGWLILLVRLPPLAFVVIGGLLVHLTLRLIEAPVFRAHRPITPFVTQAVCRMALLILGLRVMVHGKPMQAPGALVANHSSWLDVFVLNAQDRVYFVAKAEVRNWPLIGWLARATGTVFIRRDKRDAHIHRTMLADRLNDGHRLLFFPEGTSSDGIRVLPFKTTLFQALRDASAASDLAIQPVSLAYLAPKGQGARYYGWYGEMGFLPNLIKVLATRPQGRIVLRFHGALAVKDFADRKALAAASARIVEAGLLSDLPVQTPA